MLVGAAIYVAAILALFGRSWLAGFVRHS
jgi:hypothetical protein